MHDLDGLMTELSEHDESTLELGEGEFASEYDEGEGPFERDEMALATELLSVSSEEELDHFLGDLIKKAGSAIGKAVRSPVGRALGGILKSAAKVALPVIGNAVMPGVGGALASKAGDLFGLETEGLSNEDREFEEARSFVRFANTAAQEAAQAPPTVPPQQAARAAVVRAAQQHAPGLLRGAAPRPPAGCAPRMSGRWIRRGDKIVILGV
jgi:hypothetical protein